jgi:hypothetical protein
MGIFEQVKPNKTEAGKKAGGVRVRPCNLIEN